MNHRSFTRIEMLKKRKYLRILGKRVRSHHSGQGNLRSSPKGFQHYSSTDRTFFNYKWKAFDITATIITNRALSWSIWDRLGTSKFRQSCLAMTFIEGFLLEPQPSGQRESRVLMEFRSLDWWQLFDQNQNHHTWRKKKTLQYKEMSGLLFCLGNSILTHTFFTRTQSWRWHGNRWCKETPTQSIPQNLQGELLQRMWIGTLECPKVQTIKLKCCGKTQSWSAHVNRSSSLCGLGMGKEIPITRYERLLDGYWRRLVEVMTREATQTTNYTTILSIIWKKKFFKILFFFTMAKS